MNKRTFEQSVAQQKIAYENQVFAKRRKDMPDENNEDTFCESSVIHENDVLFSEKLKAWYIDTRPTKVCVEKLLTILYEEGLDVPLSLEALFERQTSSVASHVSSAKRKAIEQQQKLTLQNIKICEILAEHKVLLNQLQAKDRACETVMEIFPINSETQLIELEAALATQKDLYVRYMTSLIKGDITKNLGQILGQEIVMTFNAEGVQGKKRLKDYKNVYDAIIEAISEERAEEKFRTALQFAKNKYHKLKSKQKSMEKPALLSVDSHCETNSETHDTKKYR